MAGLFALVALAGASACSGLASEAVARPSQIELTVERTPLHAGRITRLLYGGFIELIDDLVPGMWAEMLNDRGFDGIEHPHFFHLGEPNILDRPWAQDRGWRLDDRRPFSGKYCARVEGSPGGGGLRQAGMFVQKGMGYRFEGFFRSDDPGARVRVRLRCLLPSGDRMELGSIEMKGIGADWGRITGHFRSTGTTDQAVFELTASGKGAVWADKLSLMPDDNVEGWRKDVVDLVRAWHPGVIRFGGSLQEFGYRWSQGIEPRERRQPFHNQYWGRCDTNDVGIGEFITFCRLVGAEPLICASWQDGPRSAHDLVEFCNGSVATPWGSKRAEWGHPEPYRVKYWQVGNEQWGDAYDKALGDYCKAIRDAAPDAIIVASDNTPMLLQKQSAFVSYVCRHYYNMGDYDWCEAQLKEDRAVVEQSGLARPPKLSITEWNVSAADWGLGRLRQVTLQAGLANARFLSFMQRNCDFVGLACRSNMANSFLSGTIQTRMGQVLKTPAYLMLKMYGELSLPVPVRVSGSGGLDTSGCRSEDGTDLTVFLVNTKDQPVQVRVDLGAYPGMRVVAARAVGDKEDRRAPDIVNLWSAPDSIGEFPLEVKDDAVVIPAYSAVAIQARSGARG